jgi:DnaD/phage-associated family protein
LAWIELHQSRQRHPKTLHLARLIKKDRRYTCGLLDDLWTWALDIAERDGLLPGLTGEDIAVALDFPASKGKWLVGALVESGYIDVCSGGIYRLHDWQEYAGKLVERREEQRKYASRQRSLYSNMRVIKAVRQRDGSACRYCGKIVNWDDRRGIDGGTYDHVDPDGDNSVENIVVACRSCNSKKQDRTPEEACMPLLPAYAESQQKTGRKQVENQQRKSAITVPYPTVPNHTVPKDITDVSIMPSCSTFTEVRDGGGDALSKYFSSNLRHMSSGNYDELRQFLADGIAEDVARFAVDTATAAGKPTWAFTRYLLNQWLTSDVKTVGDAKAYEHRRAESIKTSAKPNPALAYEQRPITGNGDELFTDLSTYGKGGST